MSGKRISGLAITYDNLNFAAFDNRLFGFWEKNPNNILYPTFLDCTLKETYATLFPRNHLYISGSMQVILTSSLFINEDSPPWVWKAGISRFVIRSTTLTARVAN